MVCAFVSPDEMLLLRNLRRCTPADAQRICTLCAQAARVADALQRRQNRQRPVP